MSHYELTDYQKIVKEKRSTAFPSPYDLAYSCFTDLGYIKESPDYFLSNASLIVENMRRACWDRFLPMEKEFTAAMLKELISAENFEGKNAEESIISFVEDYTDHIYQLSLSNTQSRRSRAGKEFEAIIELLLIGAGIPMDSQGNIGKREFVSRGLGKLVDVVSPGVVEFIIDKNDVTLISAKTTLRERWQEVPEEMSRTGASSMYLATVDESVTDEVILALYEANIRLTTTKRNKETNYKNDRRVVTFEQLLQKCCSGSSEWSTNRYSNDEFNDRVISINIQKEKHSDHPFVFEYYDRWVKELEKV